MGTCNKKFSLHTLRQATCIYLVMDSIIYRHQQTIQWTNHVIWLCSSGDSALAWCKSPNHMQTSTWREVLQKGGGGSDTPASRWYMPPSFTMMNAYAMVMIVKPWLIKLDSLNGWRYPIMCTLFVGIIHVHASRKDVGVLMNINIISHMQLTKDSLSHRVVFEI